MAEIDRPDPDPLNPPVQGYEFFVAHVGQHEEHEPEIVAKMNEYGADGWMLVAADGTHLYFQRPLAKTVETQPA